MINNFVLCQSTITRLSFAVHLKDDFSGLDVTGMTRVFINGHNRDALQNPSGFFVFTDLTKNTYTLHIENKYYHSQELDVTISSLAPLAPLVDVTMVPNYLYPFPKGSTLVRGRVNGSTPEPVPAALVEIAGTAVRNHSEFDGRFVLYFGPLTEDKIQVIGKHHYVKSLSGLDFDLNISHPDYVDKTEPIGRIEEGKSKLVTTPVLLVPI